MPLLSASSGPLGWLIRVRPDAFLGAFVWEFVACFPTDLQGTRARAAKGVAAAGIVVGVWLAGANLAAVWPPSADVLPPSILAVSRNPVAFYWPVLLVVTVPAFFALLLRARVAEGVARRQVQIFVGGLVVGVGPIALEVLIEGLWKPYENFVHTPALEPWVGAVM